MMFHFKGKAIEFVCDSRKIALRSTPFDERAGESMLLFIEGTNCSHGVDLLPEDFYAIRDRLLSEGRMKRCHRCGLEIHEQDLEVELSAASKPDGSTITTERYAHRWCLQNGAQ